MSSILERFACEPDCPRCAGYGHVCEDHPDLPWGGLVPKSHGGCECGAAGMPCQEENRT